MTARATGAPAGEVPAVEVAVGRLKPNLSRLFRAAGQRNERDVLQDPHSLDRNMSVECERAG